MSRQRRERQQERQAIQVPQWPNWTAGDEAFRRVRERLRSGEFWTYGSVREEPMPEFLDGINRLGCKASILQTPLGVYVHLVYLPKAIITAARFAKLFGLTAHEEEEVAAGSNLVLHFPESFDLSRAERIGGAVCRWLCGIQPEGVSP